MSSDGNYIHFSFNTRKLPDPVIRVYPLVCFHIGALQCDMRFLREHLSRIKEDPCARWVYMGDGGECVTKYSKGDIAAQLLNPQQQMDVIVDLLEPLKDKGLFGIRGNHGHRVYKETGLSFDHTLCQRLGIPYLGAAAMANLLVNRSSYDAYFHHGIDSGITQRVKISKAEHFNTFIDADAIFTAHSHIAVPLQPAALLYANNLAAKTGTKLRYGYICGSAYDSRTGYAEDKGYPPLLPSFIRVEFDGRIVQGFGMKGQEFTRFVSDGQHELKHEYIGQYIGRRDE